MRMGLLRRGQVLMAGATGDEFVPFLDAVAVGLSRLD